MAFEEDVRFREELPYKIALAEICRADRRLALSSVTARWCALILMGETSPDPRVLERAARLGTLNKIDRRAQYNGPERARPEALLDAVNAQGNHIRGLQSDTGKLQHDLYNLKLRNGIVTAVVTAALVKAPEIVAFLGRWLR